MVKDILWLHQALKLEINEMDSNVNSGYPPELLDIVINKATLAWLKDIVTRLESTAQIEEKLSSLVIRTPLTSQLTISNQFQTPLAPAVSLDSGVEFRYADLKYPFYQYLSAKVKVRKGECEQHAKVRLEQHDDIEVVLRDVNRRPSWRYREVVGTLGRDSREYTVLTANNVQKALIVHADKNCTIGNLYLTYLKIPNQVSIGGYKDLNGNTMTRTELDIPQEYYPEIVKFAKMEVAQTIGFTNK